MPKPSTTAVDFKQKAHTLVDQLPEGANWKDLAYEISIIQDIEEGIADSVAGRVTENNEVRRRFGLPELHGARRMPKHLSSL